MAVGMDLDLDRGNPPILGRDSGRRGRSIVSLPKTGKAPVVSVAEGQPVPCEELPQKDHGRGCLETCPRKDPGLQDPAN